MSCLVFDSGVRWPTSDFDSHMYCNYCGRSNPENSLYCSSCGRGIQSPVDSHRLGTDPKPLPDVNLVRFTVIANDREHRLWNSEDVEDSRRWLETHHKQIPSLGMLRASFDEEAVEEEIKSFVDQRIRYLETVKELVQIDQHSLKCHKCGASNPARYPFGLAKIIIDKRTWSETIASVALSAVTLPTIGIGRFSFPGRKRQARILRFQLLLCSPCASFYSYFFKLREEAYSLHPCWEPARRLGFNDFLTDKELQGFK